MIRRICLAALVVSGPFGAVKALDPEASTSAVPAPYFQLEAPLFSEDFASVPVASVEGDIVTLRELTGVISSAHESMSPDAKAGKRDVGPLLNRIVDGRVLALEARDMGIDELPECVAARDEFKAKLGMDLLRARALQPVGKDPADVERIYREAVREWKVRSVLFVKEKYAKAFAQAVRGGKSFEKEAAVAVADKRLDRKAQGGDVASWLPRAQMLPHVLAALQKLKLGETSSPIFVPDGYAVMKVEEERFPENKAARAEAERTSKVDREKAALQKYYDGLVKSYATVDRKLLKSLDFDAPKPGMEALGKDQRVLAQIKGGKPITVADLTAGLGQSYFHGVSIAQKGKKVNKLKESVFDALLSARVVPLEVKRQQIEQTPEFATRLTQWERQYLFSKFVDTAIVPSVKIDDALLRKYYDEHKSEFTYPAFYTLESIAFTNAKDAQSAVDRLRSGTDFKWLNANADGKAPRAEVKDPVEGTLSAAAMPKGLADALAGASKGDCRPYAAGEKLHFAIHVIEAFPSSEQPFEQARDGIRERVFGDEVLKAIKNWAEKARANRDVKIFIKKIGS
jgi:parvulin-like peptidyl-prolyl isomerase